MIDYKNKFDAIQDILQAANTTTANYDLSSSMNDRVQLITQRNPLLISNQASLFPAIAIRLDDDDKEFSEITPNSTSLLGKLKTTLGFTIIGMLWFDKFTSAENDQADIQIHYLMSNIEEVLRRNVKLNNAGSNKALYSYTERISYYETLDEESHFRTGVMDFKVVDFY